MEQKGTINKDTLLSKKEEISEVSEWKKSKESGKFVTYCNTEEDDRFKKPVIH